MNTIKTLLVDDERYNRDELRHLLKAHPSMEIVGEAETGELALVKTLELQPHAVFLDIEMPKMNGLETANYLNKLKNTPVIIFATAYPQFGAEAFRYEAIDYLLKPYDEAQLGETVKRVERRVLTEKESYTEARTEKLAVEGDGEIYYLEPHNILYIYRDEKYCRIITGSKIYEAKVPLKVLESRLKRFSFFRIHKSYLVNLAYVTRLTPWFNGAYQLEINGQEELLSVSRNYVKALRERLEI